MQVLITLVAIRIIHYERWWFLRDKDRPRLGI